MGERKVGFYEKGYLRDATLEAPAPTLPAVRFKYMPLSPSQMKRVTKALSRRPDWEAHDVFVSLVCDRVKEWDLEKPNGDTVLLAGNSVEIASCVYHRLVAGIADMVLDSAGDEENAQADFTEPSSSCTDTPTGSGGTVESADDM